jgi:tetratricopeptide (TPR) repeat protein
VPVDVPPWLHGEQIEPAPSAAAEQFETEEELIPSWLQAQVVEERAPADPLPDWLAGADLTNTEVPQWLLQTVEEGPSAPPAPAPAAPPAVEPPAAPPPRAAAAVQPSVQAAVHLEQARQHLATDVNLSLQHYEAVVRANAALDEVVQDLSRAIADKAHKSNPAVYRVLGDALMRQGKLQDALSTYRKALNLLG